MLCAFFVHVQKWLNAASNRRNFNAEYNNEYFRISGHKRIFNEAIRFHCFADLFHWPYICKFKNCIQLVLIKNDVLNSRKQNASRTKMIYGALKPDLVFF